MLALYHYSTVLHLPFILASGELQPSRPDSHGHGHHGVLWYSTNAQLERTIVKRGTAPDFAPPYVRWRVAADEAVRWPQIGRLAGYRQHTIRGLEAAGRAMGARPGEWWGQLSPYRLDRPNGLEVRVGSRWMALHGAALGVEPVRVAGLEGLRLRVGGNRVCDVVRIRASDGAWGYATNTATARFDHLLTAAEAAAIAERALAS
jgi:hypothetical protein